MHWIYHSFALSPRYNNAKRTKIFHENDHVWISFLHCISLITTWQTYIRVHHDIILLKARRLLGFRDKRTRDQWGIPLLYIFTEKGPIREVIEYGLGNLNNNVIRNLYIYRLKMLIYFSSFLCMKDASALWNIRRNPTRLIAFKNAGHESLIFKYITLLYRIYILLHVTTHIWINYRENIHYYKSK